MESQVNQSNQNNHYAKVFEDGQSPKSELRKTVEERLAKYWVFFFTILLAIAVLSCPLFFYDTYKKFAGFFIDLTCSGCNLYSFNLFGFLLFSLTFSILMILGYYNLRIKNIRKEYDASKMLPFEIYVTSTETTIKSGQTNEEKRNIDSADESPSITSRAKNDNSEAKTSSAKHQIDFKYIEKTIRDLDESIAKYNVIGLIALDVTVTTLTIAGAFIFNLFEETTKHLQIFNENPRWVLIIITLLLRTSLLGTFLISFMIYAIKFTTSAFDQAVRFNKRKHASLFLMQVFSYPEVHKNELDRIMTAFKEWNVSIESAFTDNNFNNKMAETIFSRMSKVDEMYQKAFDIIKSSPGKEESKKE